jgi:hypothetical protein
MSKFQNALRRTAAALSIALVLGAVAASPAQASQIFAGSQLIEGTSVVSSVSYSFNVSGPGVLTVNLEDMQWPTSLSDLTFTATTPSSVIGLMDGAGQASFNVTGGGTIYAYVTGEATAPTTGMDYGIGLYSINVGFTPVSLPPSVLLLLAALLGLGLLNLGFRKNYRFLHAPPQSV